MSAAVGFLVIAAALVAAALAVWRTGRREGQERLGALGECVDLLDEAVLAPTPSGYGALRGRCRGRPAALTPIAEALAFRRLPQLWLSAAIRSEADLGASIEILRRPAGSEFFFGGDAAQLSFPPPASWPQDTRVKGDRAGAALLPRLETLLGEAFADPRVKAVTVSRNGVRVVRQAAQGARGSYLLFRDARFPAEPISRADAEAALNLAADLLDRLTHHDAQVARAA